MSKQDLVEEIARIIYNEDSQPDDILVRRIIAAVNDFVETVLWDIIEGSIDTDSIYDCLDDEDDEIFRDLFMDDDDED